jgi:hypothetical protein
MNFVKYVLCCVEDQDESSFFAVLTQVSEDGDSPLSLGKKFIYGWNKILFTSTAGSLPNFGPTVINQMIGAGWTYDKTEYCDLTKVTDTDYKGKPAAINLNERGNTGTSITNYYVAPGWDFPPGSFSYRYIGYSKANTGIDIKTPHVVKMYKKSITSLLRDSDDPFGILQDPDYESKYFYYFSAENVVDGECT